LSILSPFLSPFFSFLYPFAPLSPSQNTALYIGKDYVFTNVSDKCIACTFRVGVKNPEDGGAVFLRNVGNRLQDYTALQPRRSRSIYTFWCPDNRPTHICLSVITLLQKRDVYDTSCFYCGGSLCRIRQKVLSEGFIVLHVIVFPVRKALLLLLCM
jgi:hypothetical protein